MSSRMKALGKCDACHLTAFTILVGLVAKNNPKQHKYFQFSFSVVFLNTINKNCVKKLDKINHKRSLVGELFD